MGDHTCHSRESGNPVFSGNFWIPAFAGMTENLLLANKLCQQSLVIPDRIENKKVSGSEKKREIV